MVFQSYAVWPHMTVAQNVAYPLEVRRWPRHEIAARVDQVLELVGLARWRDQYATRLSGGQQQRVALARALIYNPRLLLFDEPLSNLDAKLREQLRIEIVRLQREVGITSVYVTHDQAEAMVISDQIIVMNRGRIEQQGDARAIYTRPANRFVAEFIGLANLLPGRVVVPAGGDGGLRAEVALGDAPRVAIRALQAAGGAAAGKTVWISIRPEDVEIGPAGGPGPGGENRLEGTVASALYMGNCVDYHVDIGGARIRVQARADTPYREGDRVALTFPPTACVCIPGETGRG
jgi:iron(III) transport system ATP-binding protein